MPTPMINDRWQRRGTAVLLAALMSVPACLFEAPTVFAAPPANDDFANREALFGSLPIEVTRSNVGATKEVGEYIPAPPAPAGHSVWFEWEATGTGFVTIGACDDDFPTILAVFTGSELGNLTQAASGNADEGPDCPYSGRQYTFMAISGTKYVIAVDGNIFHLPESPTPVTEGQIVLRIESTPTPPNDDFADATFIDAPIEEEPGGDRFYFANARGYNWNATTEPGEFPYGTNSGASVWFRWIPPEAAKYRLNGPCCGGALNWALFSGGFALEDEMLAATGSAEVMINEVKAYWISVYGTPMMEATEPSMASFSFLISAKLPPLPPPPDGDAAQVAAPGPDLVAPDTRISRKVLKRKPPIYIFGFSSSEPGSTFRCSVDRKPFKPCAPRKVISRPDPGRHRLSVYAVDAAGNADPTPAVVHFMFRRSANHRGPAALRWPG